MDGWMDVPSMEPFPAEFPVFLQQFLQCIYYILYVNVYRRWKDEY